jgi:hypothetical protein
MRAAPDVALSNRFTLGFDARRRRFRLMTQFGSSLERRLDAGASKAQGDVGRIGNTRRDAP